MSVSMKSTKAAMYSEIESLRAEVDRLRSALNGSERDRRELKAKFEIAYEIAEERTARVRTTKLPSAAERSYFFANNPGARSAKSEDIRAYCLRAAEEGRL